MINRASGATVASVNVAQGELATIPLAPGSYTITATDADATFNGVAMRTRPQAVRIVAGMTVRQDVFVAVP